MAQTGTAFATISLELFSILLALIMIFFLTISEDRNTRLNRLFILMLVINIGVLASDAITFVMDGVPNPAYALPLRIANFFVYSLGYVLVAIFTDYLVTYIATKTAISRTIVHVIWALCVVAVLLVLLSQFNNMYYYYDETNTYHRQDWYWLSQVWAIVIMICNMVITVLYRKHLNTREFVSFLSYGVFPVLAMVIQIFVYGLTLLYLGTTLSLLIIYQSIQVEQSRRLKEQEQELAESRIAIMLSQIQPHFLYNSLIVIKQLCDIDPMQAKQAVVEFSDYLRGNLDSLTLKQPIPFSKELEHVKTYLALEEKRFGEKLRVEFDIREERFVLPALTLQPLVENAVRYGVIKKDAGGTVTISTGQERDCWLVTVADNGVGFDPVALPKDGRSHVGIANVRTRLVSMCGGHLEIKSTTGAGTTATIILPKEAAKHEHHRSG